MAAEVQSLNSRGSLNDLTKKGNVLQPDDNVKEEWRRTAVTQIQTGERHPPPPRILLNEATRSCADNTEQTL